MSSMTFYISNLLEKMTSTDKDFRFMAANDLMMELQKDSIKLDEESERKIVAMLLKLLEDKNGEVQNLAVKCLGPLVGKVKQGQVDTMVDTLCSNMVSDKEQLRDISSMGLKTLIAELPLSSTDSGLTVGTCRRIISQLIGAVGMQDDVSIQLEALDIISEMLGRLSNALGSFHQSILSSLLAQLTNPRMAVRKRSIIALGHLVPSCGPDLFDQLIQHLGEELTRGPPTANIRTCIQCLATVSRAGGYRIGIYLDKLVPMVVTFCNMEDDELCEFCFQAFEAFVSRCPKEMSPHISTVTKLCLQYIAYDPNYNYDADDEDNMDLEEGEDEDQESDDEYSDDDDMSWKVRHSSVKCLEAIILSRGDLLVELYGSIAPTLLSRFKEREENVKTVIFSAFVALLKQTRRPAGSSYDSQPREEAAASLLKNMIPAIIKALQRHLKDRSMKCRQSCFSLLTELTTVLPGNLQEHVSALIPGVIYSLTDKSTSSNMKINALSFLYVFLRSHSPEILPPYINIIIPAVIQCVQDPFYKITSEALHVTQQIVKMMRPLDRPMAFDAQPYVKSVFSCTLARLKATDIDQEVKERAIFCMGHILNHLGDHLGDDLQVTLQIFLERLRNEITRLVTVKTLILVASSPLQIDLSPILSEAIPTLASFLRKTQRALKLTTIAALKLMVKTYSGSFKPPVMESVMCEVPALIQESDMHVSQEVITLLTCMLEVCPAFLSQVKETILPKIFKLVYSPLLQGGALTSILQLLQVLVTAPGSGMTCGDLLKTIKSPFTDTKADFVHRQSYFSVAKCVAALIAACPREVSGMVTNLVLDVKSPKTPEAVRILSLRCLGEIGRVTSFEEQKDLRGIIMEVFNSPNEEVKSAASFALANISIGNLEEYLPFLLKEITAQPKKQYLLLHSLKEALSALSAQRLKPHVENIWTLLFQHCECAEEGTRGIVAECLGKLTLVNPSEFLPRLKTQLSSGSPLLRSTVVTAIKFTIVDQPMPIDSLLNECIGDFLKSLQDPDPNVRRVTLVMFNSAAHNKPFLIRRLLTSLLPHLYAETRIRKELIREVEMGPFKHTVDDGLDVRKAAFECMYTLLDNCLDCVDVFEYLNYVEEGLKDHYDIKMLTFIMLARLSKLCPAAVVQRLDRLIEPLKATCSTKVKTGSVKQEFEKQEELRRSALRAIAALLSISEVQKSPAMADFTNQIRSNSEMATIFDSLQEEPLTEKMESMETS